MKKFLMGVLALCVWGSAMVAAQYKDGIYYAAASNWENSGWRSFVVVEVKGGKIAAVNWNGTNNLAVEDKKTYSAAGSYGMEKTAKQGAWHVQAKRVEDFLVANQQLTALRVGANGKTDAITGASITISDFANLVKEALAKPAVPRGIYKKDGVFTALGTQDSGGWTDHVQVVVVNGTVVDAVWNARYKDSTKKTKLVESITAKYGMKGAKGEWHVQAVAVQNHLVRVQDPAKVTVAANNKVDAISGASITSGAFFTLAGRALQAAR